MRNRRESSSSACGQTVANEPRHFVVDRRDRAIDVLRTDAGADEQRPSHQVRVERAEHVVGHPLLLANAVAEAAAHRVLPEGMVHQPARVVRRIGARQRGEPVRDVGLRLVHHRNDQTPARAAAARPERNGTAAGGGAVQSPKTLRHDGRDPVDRPRRRRRPPSARPARIARREARAVDRASDRSTTSALPLARKPYGCGAGYSSDINASTARTPGLSSSCRIDVTTSPLRVASSASGTAGARTMSPSERHHGLEILRQAGAHQREEVPRHAHAQRDAAAVEGFGDVVGRTRRVDAAVPRSMTRDSRYIAPGASGGSQTEPGAHGQVDRDGRHRARLLRQHDDAVGQYGPGRRQTGRGRRVAAGVIATGSGSNQPMVRFDGARIVRAASATASRVTAAMRAPRPLNTSTPAMVSKYPSWWAMLVTLSLSKTSRALSCALALTSSASVMPSRADQIQLARSAPTRPPRAACRRSPSRKRCTRTAARSAAANR